MSKHRLVRFCYLSSDWRRKGRRYQHQLRDGDAALELMPFLLQEYDYDGVFINWPKVALAADTSIADFKKLKMGPDDILLLTTRPPIHDKVDGWKSLSPSESVLEEEIFDVLKQKCFHRCSREAISLHSDVGTKLGKKYQKGKDYQNRSEIHFEIKGQEARYTDVFSNNPGYEPWSPQMSCGYVLNVSLGSCMPRLLAIFGISGTLTLCLCHILRKHPKALEEDVLGQAIKRPSLTLVEMERSAPIPGEKELQKLITDDPYSLDFCLAWDLEIIRCDLV